MEQGLRRINGAPRPIKESFSEALVKLGKFY
jgi:hypothetical protein